MYITISKRKHSNQEVIDPPMQTTSSANNNQDVNNYENKIMNVISTLNDIEISKIKRIMELPANHMVYENFLELLKFLLLKAEYIYISMPYHLDLIWHVILLFPTIYQKICLSIYSQLSMVETILIEHDPFGGDDVRAQSVRAKSGLERYKQHFPSDSSKAALVLYQSTYDHITGTRSNSSSNSSSNTTPVLAIPTTAVLATVVPNVPVVSIIPSPTITPPPVVTTDPTLASIKLSFRSQDGNRVTFSVIPTIQFSKLFIAYADRVGIPVSDLVFMWNGDRLDPKSTPKQQEFVDGYFIDVCIKVVAC